MKKMFQETLRKSILGFALLLVAVASVHYSTGVSAQTVDPANPYAFEKKAYKPDGTPWTGPVNVGDIIKYVLSYQPGTTNSGPVTIDDTLSANQTYVAPTTGPGWTWSATPYSTGNHETYNHPGFGPGQFVKITVTGIPAPTFGQGDGTKPIPVGNRVFGVYHHALSDLSHFANVDCWDLVSLAKCAGYPKPNHLGLPIYTPQAPNGIVRGGKIFFIGTLGPSGIPTIGCFDTGANSACPDTPLTSVPAGDWATIGGLEEDPVSGAVFAVVHQKVYCRIWTGSVWNNCPGAGWIASGTVAVPGPLPTTIWQANLLAVAIQVEKSAAPTHVYVHVGQNKIQCLDIVSGAVCSSWPASGLVLASANLGAMFSSVPAGSGENGVCLWSQHGQVVGCVDQSGAALAAPADVGGVTVSSFRVPNTGRVFFGQHASGPPVCQDYNGTTGGACAGFVPAWPSAAWAPASTWFQTKAWVYGFALDPLKPEKCMLALGDQNLMWRFDYHTGEVGCGTTTFTTPDIKDLFCNGLPDPAKFQWNEIRVLTPLAAGTLSITQGTNPSVTQTITSGTTVYTMPVGIGPGFGPLKISFTPAAGSPAAVDLEIGYTSDKNPEICYQAEVKSCGPLFNDAVFKGSYNGAAVAVAQKVDLGKVPGAACDQPGEKSCLSSDAEVTCGKTPGTYIVTIKPNGVGGVIPDTVQITSLTPSITVSPVKPSYPVIGGQVQITLLGAHPGDIINLQVIGTTTGQGSVVGSDLCCSGKIRVVIPKDLDCWKEEPPKLKVEKICDPAIEIVGAINRYEAKCKIKVTSSGHVTGPLSISEVLGGTGTITNISHIDPWTCLPNPNVPANTPVNCTMPGSNMDPAGDTSVIDVTVSFANAGDVVDAKNCAALSLGGKPVGESCTPFGIPHEPKLVVTKVCGPATAVPGSQKFEADCKITVTATGSPLPAQIVITEGLNGPINTPGNENQIISMTSPQNWSYPSLPLVAGTPGTLQISGADLTASGGTSVVNVHVQFHDAGNATESKNCVLGTAADAAGGPLATAPKVCVPFGGQQPPNLKVEKTGPENCKPHQPCDFNITITNQGQPFNGDVLLWDAVTPNPWNVLSITPNLCGATAGSTPFGCVANINLAANQSLSFKVSLATPGTGPLENENCISAMLAPVGLLKDKIYSQAELAEVAAQNPAQQMLGQSCWKVKTTVDTPPKCDPRTTKLVGDVCRCTIEGQIPISKTACDCPDGTELRGGKCQKPLPKCDPATSVSRDGQCACKFDHMDKVTASSCSCQGGYEFRPGRGCVKPQPICQDGTLFNPAHNRCEPICRNGTQYNPERNVCMEIKQPPKCDLTTSVPRGDSCMCRYPNMQSDGQGCSCRQGEKFVPGRGCMKPQQQCQDGTQFNQERSRCEPICRAPSKYDPRQNACIAGNQEPTPQPKLCKDPKTGAEIRCP